MKGKGVLVRLMMAMVCLLSVGVGLFSLGDSALAADYVNITLHKKQMDDFPNDKIDNTGQVIQDFEDKYDPLEGITFKVWNVTEDFHAKLNPTLTGNETEAEYKTKVKAFMETYALDKANATEAQTQQTTDAGGLATFSGLPLRNSKGIYNVYYFEELADSRVNESQKLILTLPAVNPADPSEQLENIHLYPKNKMNKKDIVKEIMNDDGTAALPNGTYDYDIGKKIQFRATYRIPNQIGELITTNPSTGTQTTRYTKLEFKDEVDLGGVKFEGIDKIVMDGQPINMSDFIGKHTSPLTTKGETPDINVKAGFEIKTKLNGSTSPSQNFNNSKDCAEYLARWAGKDMQIYYSVSLTELTPIDQEVNNKFTATFTNKGQTDTSQNKEEDTPKVLTGGRKFFKYEDPSGVGLGGANFVVIKKDGANEKYLTISNNKAEWKDVKANETYADAKRYISEDAGNFQVIGLEYGDYFLREIKAPDGFQKLPDDLPFVINKGSFEENMRERVANTSKGGVLPSTGGIGIAIFLLIGGALMSFAIVRYRKTQHAV